ncbi:hypothetical protein AB4562_08975 [Vibrio sp. 10N.222.54.A1]|uniref:Uncharacterized protein n=2 Tax=Vibrio TaxID=662 RepID=A0A7Z1S4W5_9VIBR|nr:MULTISPECIES: hypothetical protein [Vibrio]PMP21880.1 hypothetical protein BCS91_19075 [Vibrio cyclitrophicus]PMP31566.1 hypothetical protein BCS90_11275 [Vibrio cyclitrophicus]TKG09958.1 hypothetical protein FCV67_05720 [Vibrio sp. F13]
MLKPTFTLLTDYVMNVITVVIQTLKYIIPTLCILLSCYFGDYVFIVAMGVSLVQAKAIRNIAYEKIVLDDPTHMNLSMFHSEYWHRFCKTAKLMTKFSVFYLLLFALDSFNWNDTFINKNYSENLALENLWPCLLSGWNYALVLLVAFMTWVIMTPIKLVFGSTEILMLEWYPITNRWKHASDITLHLADPYKPIKGKKDQLIREMTMFTSALNGSGFYSLSVNTHVISGKLWELLKITLSDAVIDVNKKRKNWLDFTVYKVAIYVNHCGLKGKSYQQYRDLIGKQRFENNHIVKIRFNEKPIKRESVLIK